MDNSVIIICVLVGIIEIIIIFSVINIMQNTKETNKYLENIENKLNDMYNAMAGANTKFGNGVKAGKSNQLPAETEETENTDAEQIKNTKVSAFGSASTPWRSWECECGAVNLEWQPFCQNCGKFRP